MNATALSPNPAPAISRRTMLIAFVFCFLGLLADGVDLVYLSQGLALLPLGTGLVGLLAGFLLHVRGRWLGALLALLPATLICAWNLYNYAAHGDEALSPSFAQYTQALLGLRSEEHTSELQSPS